MSNRVVQMFPPYFCPNGTFLTQLSKVFLLDPVRIFKYAKYACDPLFLKAINCIIH